MHPQESATPGGRKLRVLREKLGMTQLEVELEAELGTGYLQRLEYGRVKQPGRATLERILDALHARFTERREVLEVFGYAVSAQPPDEDELAWAAHLARSELEGFPAPAYVLDCRHRLVVWNRVFPRLLGENGERVVEQRLWNRSLPAAWFDRDSPLPDLVAEPDKFLPALIRAFRHEMRQFQYEPWYAEVLDEVNRIELFRHYWRIVEEEQARTGAARALVPVRLNVPGQGLMQFRLSAEPFTRDTRFRIVYYFPMDPRSIEICTAWSEQVGYSLDSSRTGLTSTGTSSGGQEHHSTSNHPE